MYDPNNISIIPRSRKERELAAKKESTDSVASAPVRVVLNDGEVLDSSDHVLSAVDSIVQQLKSGAHVVVRVADPVAPKLRNTLETRVGAGEITRAQYDDVTLEILTLVQPKNSKKGVVGDPGPAGEAGPAGDPEPEPEAKKPPKKKVTKKKPKIKKKETSRGKTAKADDLLPEELSDIFSGETATVVDDDDDDE